MYKTIKPYIYIPQLNKKIKELIRTCKDCQQNKHSFKIRDGYIESKRRLEDISSDIWGPFNIDKQNKIGTGYIVTFTDLMSRYTKIKFIDNINSDTITNTFKTEWLDNLMIPK